MRSEARMVGIVKEFNRMFRRLHKHTLLLGLTRKFLISFPLLPPRISFDVEKASELPYNVTLIRMLSLSLSDYFPYLHTISDTLLL